MNSPLWFHMIVLCTLVLCRGLPATLLYRVYMYVSIV